MSTVLDYLREFNTVSVALRLFLAMLCGGIMGLERVRKHRPAGFQPIAGLPRRSADHAAEPV